MKPKKVKKEGEKRDSALYEEAKKKLAKWTLQQQEASKELKHEAKHSRDPYLQQRFVKEYANALRSLGLEKADQLLSHEDISKHGLSIFRKHCDNPWIYQSIHV